MKDLSHGGGDQRGAALGIGPWSLLLLSFVILVVLASGLHGPDLMEPDEGRTAEISREMMVTGDYVLPRYNGLPFLDKPLLYFAAAAASMRVLGVGEVAARLPALVFALGLALLAAWFAGYLFGRRAAWIAGLATATSPLLIAFSRIAIFDSVLSFFVVLALVAFYRAVEVFKEGPVEGGGSGRRGLRFWNLLAWGAIGLGVLTKGPVALALPLLVVVPFALWRKASKAVWHPLGPLLMLGLVVPWLAAVHLREPGFLHYAFVVETWLRFTTDEMNRQGPVWYFLPYVLGGAFPWSIVALVSWWRSRGGPERTMRERIPWVFLTLWLVLPFVLFSLSQSKRPQYVLPLIPCLAIMVAGFWTQAPDRHAWVRLPGRKVAAGMYLVWGGILLAAALLGPEAMGAKVEAAGAVRWTAAALGASCLFGGLFSWRASRWSSALIALSLPVLALPVLTAPLVASISQDRSSKQLAGVLEPYVKAETEIVLLEKFPLSLPFYLERSVIFASTDADAVRSGYVKRAFDELSAREGSALRNRSWWLEAASSCSPGRLFVLSSAHKEDISRVAGAGHALLGGNRKFVVYGDCPTPQE